MPGNPLSDPNWAPNLADTIVRLVTSVRDKTTKPVLLIIIATRSLQALIEIFTSHQAAVWISYLAVGVLFTLAGMFLMSKRTAKAVEA